MGRKLKKVEVAKTPDLLKLVNQVEADGEPRLLTRDGEEVAIVYYNRPLPEPKPTSEDDPLWGIIGLAQQYEDELDPNRPTDVATNKHKYLAEAYADLHDDE